MYYFPYFQGRVPAWNLAGLLPPDPTSPGPGGPSPGAVSASGGLAHPLPHYSGAYGAQPAGAAHYSHLLPQTSETPTSHHQWPPNMEAVTSEAASVMHYKMDPDAAQMSMYYPPVHQVSLKVSKGMCIIFSVFPGFWNFLMTIAIKIYFIFIEVNHS